MAVRLARASKQPRLPQPHFGPARCMMMWPISPADSRSPRQSLPRWTKPLPMPVPTQMYSALVAFRAEPSQVSPRAPKLPSLPTMMGTLKRAFKSVPSATPVNCMFGATTTSPWSGSTTPGTATPMAVRSPAAMPPFCRASAMHFSSAATTRSGPPLRGVGHFSRPMISPDSRTKRRLHLRAADVHAQIQPPRAVALFLHGNHHCSIGRWWNPGALGCLGLRSWALGSL